jgi:hypothetical protein
MDVKIHEVLMQDAEKDCEPLSALLVVFVDKVRVQLILFGLVLEEDFTSTHVELATFVGDRVVGEVVHAEGFLVRRWINLELGGSARRRGAVFVFWAFDMPKKDLLLLRGEKGLQKRIDGSSPDACFSVEGLAKSDTIS